MKLINYCHIILLSLLCSCSLPVDKALKLSGENKEELCSVLDYYKEQKDSNMYKSAEFLIQYMPYHFSVNWHDELNNSFLPAECKNAPDVKKKMDSMGFAYRVQGIKVDIEHINANYLFNRIDNAYQTYRTVPWRNQISQKDFNEYILPYRISHENVEDWWHPIQNRFKFLLDLKIVDVDSVVAIVDRELSSWFRYDYRYSYYKPDMNYSDALKHKGGLCNHCVDLELYSLRSLGIISSKDYVNTWGNNSHGGHVWNVFKQDSIRWKPIGMGEYHKEFEFFYVAPKIFRSTFSVNENIRDCKNRIKNIPDFLSQPCFIDVTPNYTLCVDVEVILDKNIKDDELPVLSVWKGDFWKPVWYGKKVDNKILYEKMGVGLAYLPQIYKKNNRSEEIAYPIYVSEKKELIECKPNYENPICIKNVYWWEYINWCKINTTKQKDYDLLMWDGRWKKVGTSTQCEKGVYDWSQDVYVLIEEANNPDYNHKGYVMEFNNIPSNGLYKLDDNSQRPFVVRNGQIVFL
jgi:hypothetical protein